MNSVFNANEGEISVELSWNRLSEHVDKLMRLRRHLLASRSEIAFHLNVNTQRWIGLSEDDVNFGGAAAFILTNALGDRVPPYSRGSKEHSSVI